MDSVKDIVELLGKAKNIRLNVSIFFVSFAVLFGADKGIVKIGEVLETTLKGLIFVVSIRIVYWFFGFVMDVANERQAKKTARLSEMNLIEVNKILKEGEREREQSEKAEKLRNMRDAFESLDVFQLFYVQELKRQNHVNIKKGPILFSLKSKQIVRAISAGPTSESVCFTVEAESLLRQEIWQTFDELKKSSLIRFFEGIQPVAMGYFEEFVESDKVNTRNYGARNFSYFSNQEVFSKLSQSVVFLQPQSGSSYTIDPVAKLALCSVLKSRQAMEG